MIGTLPEDGPGMWVLVFDTDSDPWQLEQPPIRVTDGTNILMPEVHLAKVTGVLGDLVQSGSSILVDSATWSKCLPFARFCYTTTLPLPLSTEFLLPQLTDELRTGDLVAMIKQPCP